MIDPKELPEGLECFSQIISLIGRRKPAFFLDFDGTLAPIVSTPDSATIPAPTRDLIFRLSSVYMVCIASGRGLADVQSRVGVPTAYYAADHGHHIAGPEGSGVKLEIAPQDSRELERASYDLGRLLRSIQGVIVETKGVSLSVHYRQVAPAERDEVIRVVNELAARSPDLKTVPGKMVLDLVPALAWDKGKAMVWLLKRLGGRRSAVCPVCIGDDRTDENMFRAAKHWGVGLIVGDPLWKTLADYRLHDVEQVATFLGHFLGAVSFSSGRAG